MRALAGKRLPRRSVKTERIGGSASVWKVSPALYAANLHNVLCYALKGAPEAMARQYGIERHREGGRIVGKRCGRSQNLAGAIPSI